MNEYYLASSALAEAQGDDKFDGVRTIEEAVKAGFDGVQLFLDPRYRDPDYRTRIFDTLSDKKLGVVVHLPNVVTDEDKELAEALAQELPDARFLIHYEPTVKKPDLKGILAGWENSRVGKLDEEMLGHVEATKTQARKDNTFFVFDFGRMMYLEEDGIGHQEVLQYIRDEIGQLDPEKDVIHMTDKTSWVLKFRDCACIVGDGICADLLPDILSYEGIVVFEHENLEQAIKSLNVVRSFSNEEE